MVALDEGAKRQESDMQDTPSETVLKTTVPNFYLFNFVVF